MMPLDAHAAVTTSQIDGNAILSELHDGFWEGLLLLRDGSEARLYMRSLDGTKYTLILDGVELLRGREFRAGNIIGRLIAEKAAPLDARIIRDLADVSPYDTKADQWVSEMQNRIIVEQLTHVELVPVHGASFDVVCRQLTAVTGYAL